MALTDLQTVLNNYQSALAADSVSPQPSYSLDGQTVSRNEWRDSLLRAIVQLQQTINAQNPYIVRTKMVL